MKEIVEQILEGKSIRSILFEEVEFHHRSLVKDLNVRSILEATEVDLYKLIKKEDFDKIVNILRWSKKDINNLMGILNDLFGPIEKSSLWKDVPPEDYKYIEKVQDAYYYHNPRAPLSPSKFFDEMSTSIFGFATQLGGDWNKRLKRYKDYFTNLNYLYNDRASKIGSAEASYDIPITIGKEKTIMLVSVSKSGSVDIKIQGALDRGWQNLIKTAIVKELGSDIKKDFNVDLKVDDLRIPGGRDCQLPISFYTSFPLNK